MAACQTVVVLLLNTCTGLKVVPDSAPVKQSVGGKKPVARAPSSDLEEDARKKKRKSECFIFECGC